MKKQANTDLLRQALLGMLLGGGAYGGIRLASNISNKLNPPEQSQDELALNLPASRMKVAEDHSAMEHLLPWLAMTGGLYGGFKGAGGLYDHFQKAQIQKQQQEAEQEYLKQLQLTHQKTAGLKTPLVDSFIDGMVVKLGAELQKVGFPGIGEDVNPPDEGISDIVTGQARRLMHGVANTRLGSMATAAWLAAALGTAGMTYGISKGLQKHKEKNQAATQYPTEIKLNIV